MNQDYLDTIAQSYHLSSGIEDKFIEDISQEYFCDWIKNNYSNKLRCCEMGFGDGITARLLHNYFDSYTVVEGSPKLVEDAQMRIPELKIDCKLFEEYSPVESFDLILALHVLEHVDNPAQILKIISGWLSPRGAILILVPNRNSLHRIFAKGMGLINTLDELSPRDRQVGHQRVYDFDSLENDLNKSGFEVGRKKGFFLKPLPNSMMTSFDPKLIVEFNKSSILLPDQYLANICVEAHINSNDL
jgi:2-polyprenyl-3-methyl-5-hydroxy-6-metoxy-1,4-benzoquinol methylase